MIDDTEIISACIKGNRLAQEQLYDKYASVLYGICLRYCKNRDEAQDVLQDGFIKIYSKMEKYRGDGSFEGWLKRIMIHTALDYLKTKKNENIFSNFDGVIHDVFGETTTNTLDDDAFSEEQLLAFIQQLPEGYRIVFNLYAIEDYSHKEIAAMLNISESTSKTQLFKARNLLQRTISACTNKKVLVG